MNNRIMIVIYLWLAVGLLVPMIMGWQISRRHEREWKDKRAAIDHAKELHDWSTARQLLRDLPRYQ